MADEAPKRAGALSDPDLMKRVISAVVLALVALGSALWGGWPFALVWSIAAMAVMAEWFGLVRHEPLAPGHVDIHVFWPLLLVIISFVLWLNDVNWMPLGGVLGLLGMALFVLSAYGRLGVAGRRWAFGGFFYALGLALGTIMLRHDPALGFAAMLYLFALVWGTDVGAYFAGRGIGGPKLWPRVSPKKTWAGFIGGTLTGTLLAVLIVKPFGVPTTLPLVLVTYLLAAASQGGDLFESAVKRHFGAKDSSTLIPGHGGVMDRLDGFIVAAGLGALIGAARAGDVGRAASGLLVW